ncbi:hypothetical protein HP15_3623 [Marinobacter adhaerens HP15]|uniref:Uncharacterized protein n=1 Tax=Marinobacter adhaerens (strain DSM 23420 / HP15) TaxID=225937 RepID=E4PGS8_MARAH|nr:hypothetical protein HP15_3623 [Marinobacter adhaerens HP15]
MGIINFIRIADIRTVGATNSLTYESINKEFFNGHH